MQRRTVGPLQMLGGLQLQVAEGKPNGLYRALNVEPRDGMAQTRRGQSFITLITSQGSYNVDATLHQPNPAWTGLSQIYLGFTTVPIPDTYLVFTFSAGGGPGDACEDGCTVEFWGNDNAWHAIDVIMSSGGGFLITPASLSAPSPSMLVLTPFGWQSAQPAGTDQVSYWLRITRNTGTFADAAAVVKALNQVSHRPLSTSVTDSLVIYPRTRTGRGPYVVAVSPPQKTLGNAVWDVLDLSVRSSTLSWVTTGLLVGIQPSYARENDTCSAVYIPASDHILVSAGLDYYDIDCSAGKASVYAPDPQTDPELDPYADIGVETALPVMARVMVMFGERVFIAGFPDDPTRVQWSAPGAFSNVWPSSNIAHLNGAGHIQGAVTVDNVLYFIAENGIWRAALSDPPDGVESALFIAQAEETPCVARRSVTPIGKSFGFLSSDGVRVFDGLKSRLVSDGVRDLFRPDSEHPLACLRPERATGAWHPTENQFRLSYPSPAGQHHDTMLVVDLDDRTSWLWGADPMSAAESGVENPASGVIGQRRNGVRSTSMVWDQTRGSMLSVAPEGLICYMDEGQTDFNQPVFWYAESQTLRIAAAEKAIAETVVIQVRRDHFQPMAVSVIPDGDYARADTRSVNVEPDLLSTSAPSLAGTMTPLQLDGSVAPVFARFRKSGRNHRVRLSATGAYAPFRVMSIEVALAVDDMRR